jgi:hypothetical protein
MKKFTQHSALLLLLALFSMMTLPGCYIHDDCTYCGAPPPPPPPPPCTYGPNGVPGPAFFGVDWAGVQPTYLWCNNTALPQVFYYGTYYNTLPGTWQLYYEGTFMDGCCPRSYYWNVNFVVWVNAGTYGGCGYVGLDGLPSYLMLQLGPLGPAEIRTNKTALPGTEMEVLRQTDTETEVLYTKSDIHVQVTYTRLDASLKSSLDPKFEVKAGKK